MNDAVNGNPKGGAPPFQRFATDTSPFTSAGGDGKPGQQPPKAPPAQAPSPGISAGGGNQHQKTADGLLQQFVRGQAPPAQQPKGCRPQQPAVRPSTLLGSAGLTEMLMSEGSKPVGGITPPTPHSPPLYPSQQHAPSTPRHPTIPINILQLFDSAAKEMKEPGRGLNALFNSKGFKTLQPEQLKLAISTYVTKHSDAFAPMLDKFVKLKTDDLPVIRMIYDHWLSSDGNASAQQIVDALKGKTELGTLLGAVSRRDRVDFIVRALIHMDPSDIDQLTKLVQGDDLGVVAEALMNRAAELQSGLQNNVDESTNSQARMYALQALAIMRGHDQELGKIISEMPPENAALFARALNNKGISEIISTGEKTLYVPNTTLRETRNRVLSALNSVPTTHSTIGAVLALYANTSSLDMASQPQLAHNLAIAITRITHQVFPVETKDGPKFVDTAGNLYNSLEDWKANNKLLQADVERIEALMSSPQGAELLFGGTEERNQVALLAVLGNPFILASGLALSSSHNDPAQDPTVAYTMATMFVADNTPNRDNAVNNLAAILRTPQGQRLIFGAPPSRNAGSPDVPPAARAVVRDLIILGRITADTIQQTEDPWQNPAILGPYFQFTAREYRNDTPTQLRGLQLDNVVGLAMGLPPDKILRSLPPKGVTSEMQAVQELQALKDGTLSLYAKGKYRHLVEAPTDKIRQVGGPNPQVTVIQILVSHDAIGSIPGGPTQWPLFRVETIDGPKFVDNAGNLYNSFEDWKAHNKLPPGRMVYPVDGHLKTDTNGQLIVANELTPEARLGHKIVKAADYAALAGGIFAGGVIVLSTGGLGVIALGAGSQFGIAALGAGSAMWGGYRSADQLIYRARHSESINPFSNAEARALVLDVAANASGAGTFIAAAGLFALATRGGKIAGLLARSNTLASDLSVGISILGKVATITNGAAIVNDLVNLAQYGHLMDSPATTIASIAFRALVMKVGMSHGSFDPAQMASSLIRMACDARIRALEGQALEIYAELHAATTRGQRENIIGQLKSKIDSIEGEMIGLRLNRLELLLRQSNSTAPLPSSTLPPHDPRSIQQGDIAQVMAALRTRYAEIYSRPRPLSAADQASLSPLLSLAGQYEGMDGRLISTMLVDASYLSKTERWRLIDSVKSLDDSQHAKISHFMHNLPRIYSGAVRARMLQYLIWLEPADRGMVMGIITRLAQHEQSGRLNAPSNSGVEPLTPEERAAIRKDMDGLFRIEIKEKLPPRFQFVDNFPSLSPIDNVTTILGARGIDAMMARNGVEGGANAITALINRRARTASPNQPATLRIAIATGFTVAENMPETDGPPGAGILGYDLQKLNEGLQARGVPVKIEVVYVTDETNAPVQRAVNNSLGIGNAPIHTFNAQQGRQATAQAAQLLDNIKPDIVLFTERVGDIGRNMRAVDVSPLNPPLYELLRAADQPSRHIKTIAIGDGGNEAGMGGVNLYMPPNVLNVASPTPVPNIYSQNGVSHPTTASVSNWAAQALGGALLQKFGMLGEMHTPKQVGRAIGAAGDAGAVDGVSRVKPGEVDSHGQVAGVDGLSIAAHIGQDTLLRAALSDPMRLSAQSAPQKPVPIVLFDSGNGGIIAADTIARRVLQQTGRPAQIIIVADHGNAPYGIKTNTEIASYTNQALQTAQNIANDLGVEVIGMACNTACTPGRVHYANGIDIPVVDLVVTTSQAIVNDGHNTPAIAATNATIKSKAYPIQVAQEAEISGKSVTISDSHAVAASDWVPLVEQLQHESNDPTIRANVDKRIKKIIDQLPLNAEALYLNCTHFRVLDNLIRQQLIIRADELMVQAETLERQGQPQEANKLRDGAARLRNLPIIDPMERQADAIIAQLKLPLLPPEQRGKVASEIASTMPPPVVVTTGDAASVYNSARTLMNRTDPRVLHVDQFGAATDVDTVLDAATAPTFPNWRAAMAARRALYENQRRYDDPSVRARTDALLSKAVESAPTSKNSALITTGVTAAGAGTLGILGALGIGGGDLNAGAYGLRGGLNVARAAYTRKLSQDWTTMFVEGRITRDNLNTFVGQISSLADPLKLSVEQMRTLETLTDQFWADYQSLTDESSRRGALRKYQATVDRILGMPAASINPFDGRAPLGLAYHAALFTTFLVNDATAYKFLTHLDLSATLSTQGELGVGFNIIFAFGNLLMTGVTGTELIAGLVGRTGLLRIQHQARLLASHAYTAGGVLWASGDAVKAFNGFAERGLTGQVGLDSLSTFCDVAITWGLAQLSRAQHAPTPGGPLPQNVNTAVLIINGALILREILQIIDNHNHDKETKPTPSMMQPGTPQEAIATPGTPKATWNTTASPELLPAGNLYNPNLASPEATATPGTATSKTAPGTAPASTVH